MAGSGLVLLAALVGAAVRLLPWALDPTIPWATLAPFAKSLLAVAIEAAILTGWPVGWALAAQRLVERGEARVLASLGESPVRTLARLAPQAMVFVVVLAATSVALGREAAAPGRIVDALLAEGRANCVASEGKPATFSVPFVSATWLCGGNVPRLVGRAPLGGIVFTAAGARVSDDLRRIDLDDARLALSAPGEAKTLGLRVHVASLTLKGMAPWARASSIPPAVRALVVTASGLAASCAVVFALLKLRRRRVGGVIAVALGSSGPLAALGALRGLELRIPDVAPGAWLLVFVFVPCAAVLAVFAGAMVLTAFGRARSGKQAAGR
ncbi:hypothetical protein AKJ09_01014 [Labilithrix luteola]|uniref:Uncharacterized protein n=1 Tax=Labilithrix luteola TaxID=1391654 RepID=A0A0K1PLE5_9BACT|nr:hypothetical protein AKJ09_01014 [Labilithrix luteola]